MKQIRKLLGYYFDNCINIRKLLADVIIVKLKYNMKLLNRTTVACKYTYDCN